MRSFLLAVLAMLVTLSAASADEIDYEVSGPFFAALLPFVSEDDRRIIEQNATSVSNKSTYVLAISESGKYAHWWREGSTQDRIRHTLQICEHMSGSQCGLAVVDGEMVEFSLLPRQIKYPKKFDMEAVPFVWKRGKNHLRLYNGARRHKALALNWSGYFFYWYGEASEYKAKQNSLAHCRSNTNWGNCFLYAVNSNVVFTPDTDIFGGQ